MERRALIELLHGKGAHARALSCVEGVPFELAGVRADGQKHSLWDLVWHVNFWMDYEVRRIWRESPAYPESASLSWPQWPPRDDAQWREEVERFGALLGTLEDLARSSDADLAQPVPGLHPSHEGIASTLLSVLWQTAVHNSYHLGQIVQLRERLGIWPPDEGSDTW
jgi:uncharacterized damage-inducible protein DinB